MQLGGKPLIDIDSCNLHVLHNGFHDAGVTSVDQSWGIEELMSDCALSLRSIHHDQKTSAG